VIFARSLSDCQYQEEACQIVNTKKNLARLSPPKGNLPDRPYQKEPCQTVATKKNLAGLSLLNVFVILRQ
jgi:hypothetical protein